MYYYQEHYPNCYSLHRPDGTDFCFLQGDSALSFELEIFDIKELKYPRGCFENSRQLMSYFISQYDT